MKPLMLISNGQKLPDGARSRRMVAMPCRSALLARVSVAPFSPSQGVIAEFCYGRVAKVCVQAVGERDVAFGEALAVVI